MECQRRGIIGFCWQKFSSLRADNSAHPIREISHRLALFYMYCICNISHSVCLKRKEENLKKKKKQFSRRLYIFSSLYYILCALLLIFYELFFFWIFSFGFSCCIFSSSFLVSFDRKCTQIGKTRWQQQQKCVFLSLLLFRLPLWRGFSYS